MPAPKIAIVGAGPAGLTLARLFQTNDLSCTVFELRSRDDVGDQGGTLDLHPRGGQLALVQAGLIEEFKKLSRPEGQASKLVKFDGTVLWDENVTGILRPEEADRPEIDRILLRNMLIESLREGTIKWEKKLLEVEASKLEADKYVLKFADGAEETFDLVVGADGAWSKVRPLVTEQKPVYSGISIVEFWALNVQEKKPWLSKYVGEGSMFMFDEGRAITCQRNGNNSIRTYAGVRVPETWVKECGINWSDQSGAREALVERYFDDCSEDLKRVIVESDDALIPRPLWMLPVGLTWASRSGVTLIGDGAHLMTPFAGVGVNVAMVDALELANGLIARKDAFAAASEIDTHSIAAAVQEYETAMFKRAETFAQKTWKNTKKHFSADGGEERAVLFREFVEKSKK